MKCTSYRRTSESTARASHRRSQSSFPGHTSQWRPGWRRCRDYLLRSRQCLPCNQSFVRSRHRLDACSFYYQYIVTRMSVPRARGRGIFLHVNSQVACICWGRGVAGKCRVPGEVRCTVLLSIGVMAAKRNSRVGGSVPSDVISWWHWAAGDGWKN